MDYFHVSDLCPLPQNKNKTNFLPYSLRTRVKLLVPTLHKYAYPFL